MRALVDELLDGSISPDDRARLMDLLRSDESARRIYHAQARLTTLLQLAADSRMNLGTMPISPETLQREKRRSALLALSTAAAAMVLLGLAMALYTISRPLNLITVQGSVDATYAVVLHDEGKETDKRRLAPGDQITISRGLLRLAFPTGVEALVEGPVQLEIVSATTLRMDDGIGWFRVPENARGFTVRTDRGRVIDLGTEFGIRHTAESEIEVHVGKGKVKVAPSSPNMPETEVATGKALRLDENGRSFPIAARGSLFRQHFSQSVPHVHWSFDDLINGGYPANGTLQDVNNMALHLRRIDGSSVSDRDFQTDGIFGKAFSLQGDGFFAESDFPGIEGDAPRTVAAWIRIRGGLLESAIDPRTGHGATTPFIAWQGPATAWRAFVLPSSTPTWFIADGTIFHDAKSPLPRDEWIHVATVHTGRFHPNGRPEVIHFLDGNPVPVNAHTGGDAGISSGTSSAARMLIGALPGAVPGDPTLDADIDELHILRAALGEKEIQTLMDKNVVVPVRE